MDFGPVAYIVKLASVLAVLVGILLAPVASALAFQGTMPPDPVTWLSDQAPGVAIALVVIWWKRESDKAKAEADKERDERFERLYEAGVLREQSGIRAMQELVTALHTHTEALGTTAKMDELRRLFAESRQ